MSEYIAPKTILTYGFLAEMKVGGKRIQLRFVRIGQSSMYAGLISLPPGLAKQRISSLIRAIDEDLAGVVPDSWQITLKKGLVVYGKGNAAGAKSGGGKGLLGIDLETDISLNLSELPFIGDQFSPAQTLGLRGLRLLAATDLFTDQDIKSLQVVGESMSFFADMDGALSKGMSLATTLKFGDIEQQLMLSLGGDDKTSARPKDEQKTLPKGNGSADPTDEAETTEIIPPKKDDQAKWFKIEKKLGPVTFNQVGVEYGDSRLWLMLDMALSVSKLTLSLDGLAVGFEVGKLMERDPKGLIPDVRLRGIGIDYKSGSNVQISGSFLRRVIEEKIDGELKKRDEYSGAAIIKTSAITLSAIGSYTTIDNEPSLFVYAFLAKQIGGPSFFFVTGIAAGFGYNRTLIMPATLDDVENFPLVRMAMTGSGAAKEGESEQSQLMSVLNDLQSNIPPSTGGIFLAIGVRFTSFKLIDSFALLVATFGDKFQLKLMGISTIVAPPAESGSIPVAEVKIALRADIDPDEGTLKVDGKILPGSYLLSKKVQLTGGFAFYCWFAGEHEGDFVLTVGGYHPSFKIPAHYPRVDRFGLNWQVDDHLSLKGEAYFALTSTAVMAGGLLEANWEKGSLKAWFHAKADFIISWKPYFYDIAISVNIGASYTFELDLGFLGSIQKTFSISLSASVHIWGPEFSGVAEISWCVISFSVSFGSSATPQIPPLKWQEFRESFLPKDEEVCTISIKDGLVRVIKKEGDNPERWVLNAKNFALFTNSVVPSTSDVQNSNPQMALPLLGIAAMHIKPGKGFESRQKIVIEKLDENGQWDSESLKNMFRFVPITKGVPSGLWGELGPDNKPDMNSKVIPGALTGYTILPQLPEDPQDTADIECKNLAYNPDPFAVQYEWRPFNPFALDPPSQVTFVNDEGMVVRRARTKEDRALTMDEIRKDLESVVGSRNAMIEELRDLSNGQFDELAIDGNVVDDFLDLPQIGSFVGRG